VERFFFFPTIKLHRQARISAVKQKLEFALVAAIVLTCTLLAYWPGLSGGFFFDDEPNILNNDWIRLENLDLQSIKKAAFSADSGLLKRPISMLSFALNHYASGFDPFYFKLTNVGIHALNGIGLFLLTTALLAAHRRCNNAPLSDRQIHWLALAIAAAWLLHPLNLTSVLYVVQRMTSLSALFTILGLILYTLGRTRLMDGATGMPLIIVGLLGGGFLATLCKENGALLPLYMLVIEVSVFRFRARAPAAKQALFALFVITVAIPGVAFLSYFFSHPDWLLRSYQNRGFTLAERLLTESRVLWVYLRQIVVPDITLMGLFHDDIQISRGLTEPVTTLYSTVGFGGLIALAVYCRRRAPLVTLGLAWFVAGHSMESTIIPLELAHEHRNYLPMYGILLPCIYYLAHSPPVPKPGRMRGIIAASAIVLLGSVTALRAQQYGELFGHDLYEVRHHPDSARSNYQAGRSLAILIGNGKSEDPTAYRRALAYFQRSLELDKNSVEALFAMIYLSTRSEQVIDPAWLDLIRTRLATARVAANNVSLLATFKKQLESGTLMLPPDEVISIFRAALNNPGLSGDSRGMVQAMLASYYQNRLHDYMMALNLSYEATQSAPRQAVFNLIFARLLIATGNNDGAREQLQYAIRNDRLGVFTDDIRKLENQASKMQENVKKLAYH